MTKYFPLLPHLDITEKVEGVYELTGTMKLFGLFRYSRNMHIIKTEDGVALVNPVRADDKTLRRIEEIGPIKHIYKIGQLHNVDIPFYMDKYAPKLWKIEGDPTLDHLKADHYFEDGQKASPCGSKLRILKNSKLKEAVLIHPSAGGTLISCDAFVNMGPDPMANWLTNTLQKLLPSPVYVGPNWIKFAKPSGGDLLELLSDDFENLLTAHGAAVLGDAKEKLTSYVKQLNF